MAQATANRRGGGEDWARDRERRNREGAGAAGAARPGRLVLGSRVLTPGVQGRVEQGAPGLASMVFDVIWQKYDAICHVVLPLRAVREEVRSSYGT